MVHTGMTSLEDNGRTDVSTSHLKARRDSMYGQTSAPKLLLAIRAWLTHTDIMIIHESKLSQLPKDDQDVYLDILKDAPYVTAYFPQKKL